MKSLWNNFVYEAPGDNPGGGDVTPPVDTPAVEDSWQPSKEEFESMRESIEAVTGIVPTVNQMAQVFTQLQNQPDDPDPEEDFDLGRFIDEQMERRLAPIMPIVTSAAQKDGKERMTELFGTHEKTLGKFDHELAERAAQSFFSETGDPVKAVEFGAKYASEYRKKERDEAVAEYKASLKRPSPGDPPVDGSGNRTVEPAKSYDEVVERWSATTEV